MTSGNFATVDINFIHVERSERQRKELEGVEELAESIKRIGLIHPPVIERDGNLRVGETRWEACKLLGWTSIPVQFVEDMDEADLQALELEENVKRKQLPWLDECAAVAKYHDLMRQRDANWTQGQTAEALGMHPFTVSQKIAVHKEAAAGNERVINAPKFSTARNVVTRTNERKEQSAISAALKSMPATAGAVTTPAVPLLNVSFNEWAREYRGAPFNFLHCDFPYGVNADKHDQGQAGEMGGYEDTFEVYETLLDTLESCMFEDSEQLVAKSAHMMFWFSMDYYQYTFDALTRMGWRVNPFPLMWYKNDSTGILPDPQRGPRRSYETAFMASRGDRKLTARGAVSNTCPWPGRDKSIHMSEKPVGMLKHFMGMMVDEYSSVLDPTAGSANSLKAASSLGATTVLGLEINKEFFDRTVETYFDKGE